MRLRGHARPAAAATRSSASGSCRSCPTRRAPSAWTRSSPVQDLLQRRPALRAGGRRVPAAAYREAKNGQILEEGITEAGSMSSFIAAGTAYATHGVPTIPFFIYYSMFGFQRIGDLIWAAADMRTRGFLLGATAGRTTLNGEGLQHEDGHSHAAGLDGAEPAWPTTRPSPTSWPSSSATASAACTRTDGRHLLLHHAVQRELLRCCRCRRAATEGILKGLYKLRPARQGQGAEGPPVRQRADPAARPAGAGAAGRAVRRRRPTSGARPATRSCAATPWRWSAGTCCTRRQKPRQSYVADAAGQGGGRRSWRPAITCGRCRR